VELKSLGIYWQKTEFKKVSEKSCRTIGRMDKWVNEQTDSQTNKYEFVYKIIK